jgi:cytochrome c biogenesis protein CcmG, thiol:disulfide interchange protein DsbE
MKANILHVVLLGFCLGLCSFSALRAEAQFSPPTWVGIELELGRHGGVGVRAVVPGSPAAATDLAAGDEILSLDGEKVRAAAELKQKISARPIGRRLRLSVRNRDGALRDVILAPAARPSDVALARQRLLGRPAPAFNLARIGQGGGTAASVRDSLEAHRGHTLIIDFWATWCGPCVRALPELGALQKRWAARGVDVIGVSTEGRPLLEAALPRLGVRHPILVDESETTFRSYGVMSLPTVVIIDKQGVVRAVEVGADATAIENHLAILVGRPE